MTAQIIELNQLIAEYEGRKKTIEKRWTFWSDRTQKSLRNCRHFELRYHNSWDWLMPVIEKIAKYKYQDGEDYMDTAYPRTFGMISEDGKFMFRFNRHPLFKADTLIEAAYEAVIDFIKWYKRTLP